MYETITIKKQTTMSNTIRKKPIPSRKLVRKYPKHSKIRKYILSRDLFNERVIDYEDEMINNALTINNILE